MANSVFQWPDRVITGINNSVERECMQGRLINEVLTHINEGKTKSIVSLREIINNNDKLGSQFLQNIKKNDNTLIPISEEVREEFINQCDEGFYAKYDLYHENIKPAIQFDRDAFNELDSKFGPGQPTSISVKTKNRNRRTNSAEFTTKQTLLTNKEKQEDFNYYQTNNPTKQLKSYVTKTDVKNKITLFEPDITGTKINVRSEITDAVKKCNQQLQSITDKNLEITFDEYTSFPYYFVFHSAAVGHVMIIIKINNSYYTLGFAFPEDNPNSFSDALTLWFKEGGIFSPDPLFKLKTIGYNNPIGQPNRLIDFGILKQSHIDKLNNEYLKNIKNIICHYTETINENADGTLNLDNYSKIVPIDIVLLPSDIRYSSFGRTYLPGAIKQKNCASFAADLFSDTIECQCIFGVNNHPDNCNNLWFQNVPAICQEIYFLLFTRTKNITFEILKKITNYNPDTKTTIGGKKKSRKTKNKKYKKSKKTRKYKK
jgi:hypothetical protein